MGNIDRKEEVISTCLEQFVKKGLYRTTSRDLILISMHGICMAVIILLR